MELFSVARSISDGRWRLTERAARRPALRGDVGEALGETDEGRHVGRIDEVQDGSLTVMPGRWGRIVSICIS